MDYHRVLLHRVARCALGIDAAGGLLEAMERHLFSDVIPRMGDDQFLAETTDALVHLYDDLRKPGSQDAAVLKAFDHICRAPDAAAECAVEVVLAQLDEVLRSEDLGYREARRLLALPWSSLLDRVPAELAPVAADFRQQLETIIHEVDEGFVHKRTRYPMPMVPSVVSSSSGVF